MGALSKQCTHRRRRTHPGLSVEFALFDRFDESLPFVAGKLERGLRSILRIAHGNPFGRNLYCDTIEYSTCAAFFWGPEPLIACTHDKSSSENLAPLPVRCL